MAGKFQSRSRPTAYFVLGFALAVASGFALSGAALATPGSQDDASVVTAPTVAEGADETKSPEGPAAEAATDEAADPASEPAAAEAAPEESARLDIDCLPEDLLAKLRATHGSVTAKACAPGCLPAPSGLDQKQLDDLYGRYGVVWCRSCTQIEGHLSLNDVRRIEEAGNLELCSTPPRQMPRPGSANGNVVKSFSRIRELYRAAPTVPEDETAIAVIIGNSSYENLPEARTARNDAGAMYFFLTEHMGIRQDQVIDLRNAARGVWNGSLARCPVPTVS